jgi:hypothetical protein
MYKRGVSYIFYIAYVGFDVSSKLSDEGQRFGANDVYTFVLEDQDDSDEVGGYQRNCVRVDSTLSSYLCFEFHQFGQLV